MESRKETKCADGFYPGTVADLSYIIHPTPGFDLDIIPIPVGIILSILDLPFSFILDTICLPYDACHQCDKRKVVPDENINATTD